MEQNPTTNGQPDDTLAIPTELTEAKPAPAPAAEPATPAPSRFLTKGEILAAKDDGYEDVDVPEWGGKVRVKKLTARERGRAERLLVRPGPDGEQVQDISRMREVFCAAAIVDPNTGVRLFSDKEVEFLAGKSSAALDRVFDVVLRLARASRKDMEAAVGNSEQTDTGGSYGG